MSSSSFLLSVRSCFNPSAERSSGSSWLQPWDAISWPRDWISRTIRGRLSAIQANTKKVACGLTAGVLFFVCCMLAVVGCGLIFGWLGILSLLSWIGWVSWSRFNSLRWSDDIKLDKLGLLWCEGGYAGRLGCWEAIRDRSFEGEKVYERRQTRGERQWKKDYESWTMGWVNKVDKV